MLFWIFQQIVISLVVIVLIHSIYKFLQNNLTTPKIRDLVEKPTKQYQEIYNTFKSETPPDKVEENTNNLMKSELQNYLKELSSNNDNNNKPNTVVNTEPQAMSFSDNFTSSYESVQTI